MKRHFSLYFFILFPFFLFINSLNAQSLELEWAKNISGTLDVSGSSIETDYSGNIYLAGSFQGKVDVDPGPGEKFLSTLKSGWNASESFFAKFDKDGQHLTSFKLDATISHILTNDNGNFHLVGTFDSTVDFDPSVGVASLQSAGSADVFIAEYDENGNYISSTQIKSSKGIGVNDAKIDAIGNIYLAGWHYGSVTFSNSSGSNCNIDAGSGNPHFFTKIGKDKSCEFAIGLLLNSANAVEAIDFDKSGNVYIGGNFNKTVDLDGGAGIASFTSVRGIDGYWAKYSPAGVYMEAHSYDAGVNDLEIDEQDNLYLTGSIADSMNIDIGAGSKYIYSDAGGFDKYLVKYNFKKEVVFGNSMKADSRILRIRELAPGKANSIYIVGQFKDTIDLNRDKNGGELYSEGSYDGLLSKFNSNGKYEYAMALGSSFLNDVNDITVDKAGNILLLGSFEGTVDFDPKIGKKELTSTGKSSLFFARYSDDETNGIHESKDLAKNILIYAADRQVFVDFGIQAKRVDAKIRIISLNYQTVYQTKHTSNEPLKIDLPSLVDQVLFVQVTNNGFSTIKKILLR